MISKIRFLLLVTIVLILASCSNNSESQIFDLYNGKALRIGVIGKAPDIKVSNVTLTKIDFKNFSDHNFLEQFDAIFISKDNLEEASDPIHIETYTDANIPFLFIEPKNSFIPFLSEISYSDSQATNDLNFAVLYFEESNGDINSWKYGLLNDKKTKENIHEVYTRIFNTIEEISNKKN